jgi:hypothetical protein
MTLQPRFPGGLDKIIADGVAYNIPHVIHYQQ